jgi:hypothetical protein
MSASMSVSALSIRAANLGTRGRNWSATLRHCLRAASFVREHGPDAGHGGVGGQEQPLGQDSIAAVETVS